MMKFCSAIVLAFIAIASASRLPLSKEYNGELPLPKAIADKWPHLLEEDVNSKIVGGTQVASGGRPYQIMLLRSGSFTCGGSFISRTHVLTAAHCVHGSESSPQLFSVRYNTLTANGGTVVAVIRIFKHASYNSNTIDYDVAVLQISGSFTPGTNAAVVTLVASGYNGHVNVACIVSGWGRTSGGGSVSSNLMQVSLTGMSQADCASRWGGVNTITARMCCGFTTGKSACNGDSGGPFTCNGVQVGVVSWGSSTCTNYPSVFAFISALRTWIDNIIGS